MAWFHRLLNFQQLAVTTKTHFISFRIRKVLSHRFEFYLLWFPFFTLGHNGKWLRECSVENLIRLRLVSQWLQIALRFSCFGKEEYVKPLNVSPHTGRCWAWFAATGEALIGLCAVTVNDVLHIFQSCVHKSTEIFWIKHNRVFEHNWNWFCDKSRHSEAVPERRVISHLFKSSGAV